MRLKPILPFGIAFSNVDGVVFLAHLKTSMVAGALAAVMALVLSGCADGKIAQRSPANPPSLQRSQHYFSQDWFSPEESLAASSSAIVGTPADAGKRDPLGDPYYQVAVDRTIFNVASQPIPATIDVLGNRVLGLPSNEALLLAVSSFNDADRGFTLTTRVTSVGFLRAAQVEFRSIKGNLLTYPRAPQSRVGCFVAAGGINCRATLLAQFGIRSAQQRASYDTLLAREPGIGILWIYAYRRTHMAFPRRLCSATIKINCASKSALLEAARLTVTI